MNFVIDDLMSQRETCEYDFMVSLYDDMNSIINKKTKNVYDWFDKYNGMNNENAEFVENAILGICWVFFIGHCFFFL